MQQQPSKIFSLSMTPAGHDLVMTLTGQIGQDFLIFISDLAGFKNVILDLKDVTAISSMGIRLFTRWFAEVEKIYPKTKIVLRNMPVVIARPLGAMRIQLANNIDVMSMYAPYFCDPCDLEQRILVTSAEVRAAPSLMEFKAPEKNCPKCGAPMYLDVIGDHYFAILLPRADWSA